MPDLIPSTCNSLTLLVPLMPLSSQLRLKPLVSLPLNKLSKLPRPLMLLLETLLTPPRLMPLNRRSEPLELSKLLEINPTTHTQLFLDTTRTFISQRRRCTFQLRPQSNHMLLRPNHLLLLRP